jgi:DnaJ-class molecular chaperone
MVFQPDETWKLIEWRSSIEVVEKNVVELCPQCNGIGTITTEKLVDYHRNDYDTVRTPCKFCLGDGRVVVVTKEMMFSTPTLKRNVVPYVSYQGDRFTDKRKSYGIKLDLRNKFLERKYPELEQLTYEHYDKLVEQYYALDLLKEK